MPHDPKQLMKDIASQQTPPPVPSGAMLIAAERNEQKCREGYSDTHDDAHNEGELAMAGACYAITAAMQSKHGKLPPCFIPKQWPWMREDWKPKDRIQNLVRAGALIAAEIDRLQRPPAQPSRIFLRD